MGSRLIRVGAVAGVAGLVLLIVANVQLGTPPKATDSASRVASFLADERGRVLLFVALFAVAYILLVTFGAALRQALRAAGDGSAMPDLTYGATLWINAMGLVALATTGAAAYRSPGLSAGTARALFDVTNIGFALLGAPFAVLLASASLSGMGTRWFPRWVGWLGIAAGALNVAKVLTLFPRSGAFTPNGDASLLFVAPIWVWTIAVAVVLWRRAGSTVGLPTSTRT
jgi:Domain of unknown function (DUF4386)